MRQDMSGLLWYDKLWDAICFVHEQIAFDMMQSSDL